MHKAIAGAACVSLLALPGSTSNNVPTSERAVLSEALPQIQDPQWPQGTELAQPPNRIFTYDNHTLTWDINVPPAYKRAVEVSLQSVLPQAAIQQGFVESYDGWQDTKDNGNTTPCDTEPTKDCIRLMISNGLADPRIYKYGVDIFDTVMHETGHAINQPWFRLLETPELPADPILAAKLTTLRQACRTLSDGIYAKWLTGSKAEISAKLLELSHNFTDSQNEAAVEYANTMAIASAAIEQTSTSQIATNIAQTFGSDYCSYPGIYDLIYATPDLPTPSSPTSKIGFDPNDPRLQPLEDLQLKERHELNDSYECLDEAKSEEQWLGTDEELTGGHPYDNASEFAASLTAILVLNPHYLTNCLKNLDPADRAPFVTVINTMLDLMQYMTPDIYQSLLYTNKDVGQVISDLRAM